MRVEFVGLPAAGKTSACGAVHNSLIRQGIQAQPVYVRDWLGRRRQWLMDYLVTRRVGGRTVGLAHSSAWVLREALRRRDMRVVDSWRACAYLTIVDAHVRRLNVGQIWLVDQGCVQALWSIAMRSGVPVQDVVGAHEARVRWPQLVIELEIPVPVAARRLRGNEGGPPRSLQSRGPAGMIEHLQYGADIFHQLRALTGERLAWATFDSQPTAGAAIAERVLAARSAPGGERAG